MTTLDFYEQVAYDLLIKFEDQGIMLPVDPPADEDPEVRPAYDNLVSMGLATKHQFSPRSVVYTINNDLHDGDGRYDDYGIG